MPATDIGKDAMDKTKPGHESLRKGRVSLSHQIYFVTAVTQHREPLFSDWQCAYRASQCFEDRSVLGDAAMLAWVLMPDHAHWLIQVGETLDLSQLINRLKSASARHVNRQLGREGSLWSKTFHDRALRQDEDLLTAARYLVANPVRAGLVRKVGDYPYWNAIWL